MKLGDKMYIIAFILGFVCKKDEYIEVVNYG